MALNDTPSKRFKPKAPATKFNWVGDPADRLRGKGDAITGDQSQSMLGFNRNLTEPLDRGGGSAIRINGAPVALAGTGIQSIGRRQQWQQTTPAQAAAIATRFPGAYPARNPERWIGPPNPHLVAAAPTAVVPPPTVSPTGQITPPLETLADNPNTAVAPTVDNPNIADSGATAQPTMLTGRDPSVGREDTAELNGGGGPGAPVTNPHTGAPASNPSLDAWLANGGTLATFHRAQVAEGLRAPIDAHATPSVRNSTASADLRSKMGFGASTQADSTAISGQMTQEFDQNHTAGQATWQKRFDDAHSALMKSLSMDQ